MKKVVASIVVAGTVSASLLVLGLRGNDTSSPDCRIPIRPFSSDGTDREYQEWWGHQALTASEVYPNRFGKVTRRGEVYYSWAGYQGWFRGCAFGDVPCHQRVEVQVSGPSGDVMSFSRDNWRLDFGPRELGIHTVSWEIRNTRAGRVVLSGSHQVQADCTWAPARLDFRDGFESGNLATWSRSKSSLAR